MYAITAARRRERLAPLRVPGMLVRVGPGRVANGMEWRENDRSHSNQKETVRLHLRSSPRPPLRARAPDLARPAHYPLEFALLILRLVFELVA